MTFGQDRPMKRLLALCLALLVATLVVALGSCSAQTDPPAASAFDIGPAGGTVTMGDVAIEFPPGAFSETEHITVTEVSVVPAGFSPVSKVYRFGPRGLTFQIPATVRFSASGGQRSIVWSDSDETTYSLLPTTTSPAGVSAPISHFSLGFVVNSSDGGTRRLRRR
jgi:hypothetical protein